jgi:Arc/MetJ family transcription regulator
MRTTLDLDDALLMEVKRRAAAKGTTLTAFVEQALAAALAGRIENGSHYALAWKTHRGSSPPAVDVSDRIRLLDAMDGR